MHSVKGFEGVVDTILKGVWDRKLPCSQNLELNFSRVDPDLLSRSAG